MKIPALLIIVAALAFAGCGSDSGGSGVSEHDDVLLEKAQNFSGAATIKAQGSIAALQEVDFKRASRLIDQAQSLNALGADQIAQLDDAGIRDFFTEFTALTLEGYRIYDAGIKAAQTGNEVLTDAFVKRTLANKKDKVEFINSTDFEAIGVGDSNEETRKSLIGQLDGGA